MTNSRPHIVVSVGVDGLVTAETKGVKGATCLPYIDLLENLLEATTTDSRYNDDFTATVANTATQTQEIRDELGQH